MFDTHRLLEIRELFRLNQGDFASQIGYSREVVNKVESGKLKPSKFFIQAVQKYIDEHQIADFSHDVNILGKTSQKERQRSAQPYVQHRLEQKNVPSTFLVPLVGIKAQAGYVKGYEQTDFIDTLETYSLPPGINPKGLEWSYFEVDGDSMEPSLSAGDILLTSLLAHEDWNDIKNFCVYVILTDDQLLVKRVYRKNEKEWILISDNTESYPQVSIDLSKIKQVWTLRRHIRSKVPQPAEVKVTA